jgi:hypothetical protein
MISLLGMRCSFFEVEARCDCGCRSKEVDQVIDEGKGKSCLQDLMTNLNIH